MTAQRLSNLAYNSKEQIQTKKRQGRATQEASPTAGNMSPLPTTTTCKTSRATTVQFDPLLAKIKPYELLVASRYLRHIMTSKEMIQEYLLVSSERLRTA